LLSKDFENYELRMKKLSLESRELFEKSKKIFEDEYEQALNTLLPDDILGTKKSIALVFTIEHSENLASWTETSNEDILKKSIIKVCNSLPLNGDIKNILAHSLLSQVNGKSLNSSQVLPQSNIQRDPLFPILEDIFKDWQISGEEFLLLQHHYNKHSSFTDSLESISSTSKKAVKWEIGELSATNFSERKELFESEFSVPIQNLKKRGYKVAPVISFVSKSYYKPKNRFEKDKNRLRRTWKIALLKMLWIRFWSFDIESVLQQFDNCESFEDFFLLFYKLFEIIGEDDEAQTSFHAKEEKELVTSILEDADQKKEKILKWEKATANISSIISETDWQLEEWMLEKILESWTHFIGSDIHFWHEDDMAWIYAEDNEREDEDEEEDEKEQIDPWNTLEWNYEKLKEYFFELDDLKRQAFASWDYDEIDRINDKLIRLESQLIKIWKLLWRDE